jgi:hypothetical protein
LLGLFENHVIFKYEFLNVSHYVGCVLQGIKNSKVTLANRESSLPYEPE